MIFESVLLVGFGVLVSAASSNTTLNATSTFLNTSSVVNTPTILPTSKATNSQILTSTSSSSTTSSIISSKNSTLPSSSSGSSTTIHSTNSTTTQITNISTTSKSSSTSKISSEISTTSPGITTSTVSSNASTLPSSSSSNSDISTRSSSTTHSANDTTTQVTNTSTSNKSSFTSKDSSATSTTSGGITSSTVSSKISTSQSVTAPSTTSTGTTIIPPPITSVTGTITEAPTGFSTELAKNSEWKSNTWITTDKDDHTTVVPVLVGCPNCGGDFEGIILWGLSPIANVVFKFPTFPKLPAFHLPCIKILGVSAGECTEGPKNDPESDGPEPTDTPTKTDPTKTSESQTSISSSSSSCGATVTVTDLVVACSTGSASGKPTTSCFSTRTLLVSGCSVTGSITSTFVGGACPIRTSAASIGKIGTYSFSGYAPFSLPDITGSVSVTSGKPTSSSTSSAKITSTPTPTTLQTSTKISSSSLKPSPPPTTSKTTVTNPTPTSDPSFKPTCNDPSSALVTTDFAFTRSQDFCKIAAQQASDPGAKSSYSTTYTNPGLTAGANLYFKAEWKEGTDFPGEGLCNGVISDLITSCTGGKSRDEETVGGKMDNGKGVIFTVTPTMEDIVG